MVPRSHKRLATLPIGPQPACEPVAKRLRSWRSKRSPLMELPAEIRIKVLAELLSQQRPLKVMRVDYDRGNAICSRQVGTFSFYPAVLLVCRAIYEEGVAILYSNTICCEIWCAYSPPTTHPYLQATFHDWYLIGKGISARSTNGERFDPKPDSLKALLSRVKRLDVVVRAGVHDACIDTRGAVRLFVQDARRLPLLSEIDIHLWMGIDRNSETLEKTSLYHIEDISAQDYRDFALGPFALFRNLKRVAFTGVSSSIAEELGRVMMGQESVVELPQMYDDLMAYVDARITDDGCRMCRRLFRHGHRAEHEVDMEDERAFRRSRSKILDIIANHEAKIVKSLLDGTPPQQKLNSHDSVSDNEGPETESVTSDDLQSLSDSDEESKEDRDLKREQEKDRPSLVQLREVLYRERHHV